MQARHLLHKVLVPKRNSLRLGAGLDLCVHVKVNISNGTKQTPRIPITNPSSEGPRAMALLLFLGAISSKRQARPNHHAEAFLPYYAKSHPSIPIIIFRTFVELYSALAALADTTFIYGTFEEHTRVETLAKTHSIIVNCAASLNPPLTEAILRGICANTTTNKKPSVSELWPLN